MFTTDTQVIYENVLAGQAYSLPFDWLDNSQILVYGDSEVLTEVSEYTLDKTARTIVPLSNYGKLVVTRYTLGSDLAYNFQSTKSLRADELQRALDIIRQLAEEGKTLSLQLDTQGNYDALGKRIGNLGAPLEDSDAATKGYIQAEAMTLQDGNYSARGKRVTNIVGLVDPQDAVNKAALDSVNHTLTDLINAYASKEDYLIDGGFPDSDFERTFDGGGAYNG